MTGFVNRCYKELVTAIGPNNTTKFTVILQTSWSWGPIYHLFCKSLSRFQDFRLIIILDSWNLVPHIVLLISWLPDIVGKFLFYRWSYGSHLWHEICPSLLACSWEKKFSNLGDTLFNHFQYFPFVFGPGTKK